MVIILYRWVSPNVTLCLVLKRREPPREGPSRGGELSVLGGEADSTGLTINIQKFPSTIITF